jgi:hypothetical protein
VRAGNVEGASWLLSHLVLVTERRGMARSPVAEAVPLFRRFVFDKLGISASRLHVRSCRDDGIQHMP